MTAKGGTSDEGQPPLRQSYRLKAGGRAVSVVALYLAVLIALFVGALNAYMDRRPWVRWLIVALAWLSAPLLAAALTGGKA